MIQPALMILDFCARLLMKNIGNYLFAQAITESSGMMIDSLLVTASS